MASVAHAISKSEWLGIKSVVMIERIAEYKNGEITSEKRYFISSLGHNDPQRIGAAARLHWGIENKLHQTLDVVFKEDDCRIRDDIAALNFAWFRKMALSFLQPA